MKALNYFPLVIYIILRNVIHHQLSNSLYAILLFVLIFIVSYFTLIKMKIALDSMLLGVNSYLFLHLAISPWIPKEWLNMVSVNFVQGLFIFIFLSTLIFHISSKSGVFSESQNEQQPKKLSQIQLMVVLLSLVLAYRYPNDLIYGSLLPILIIVATRRILNRISKGENLPSSV